MTKNILVIDDDRIVARSIDKLLKTRNYGVSIAQSGEEALEIVTKKDFNLIISDMRMPNMGGIETIRRIKEYQNKANSPKSEFMAITGYANDDAPQEGALLGITNFLLKPFESDKFLEIVNNCLEDNQQKTTISESEEREEVPIKFPNEYFSIEKVIFLEQTNIMGNTYFANYILWQGEARETLLLSHPDFAVEMKVNAHIRMITHSVYHRFVEETTFGDLIEIRVTSREMKKCSFVLVFKLYNKRTSSFVGEGWQRITFFDQVKGSLCKIPVFIRELVTPIREDLSKVGDNA